MNHREIAAPGHSLGLSFIGTVGAIGYRPQGRQHVVRWIVAHFDGYPQATGRYLWQELRQRLALVADRGYRNPDRNRSLRVEILRVFVEERIEHHPRGWISFPTQCYCHIDTQHLCPSCTSVHETETMPTELLYRYLLVPDDLTMVVSCGDQPAIVLDLTSAAQLDWETLGEEE